MCSQQRQELNTWLSRITVKNRNLPSSRARAFYFQMMSPDSFSQGLLAVEQVKCRKVNFQKGSQFLNKYRACYDGLQSYHTHSFLLKNMYQCVCTHRSVPVRAILRVGIRYEYRAEVTLRSSFPKSGDAQPFIKLCE